MTLPAAPTELADDARAEWDRCVAALNTIGMIDRINLEALAAYCTDPIAYCLAGAARPSTATSPGGEGWTGTAGSTTTSPEAAESSCVASSTVAAPAAPVVPLLRR